MSSLKRAGESRSTVVGARAFLAVATLLACSSGSDVKDPAGHAGEGGLPSAGSGGSGGGGEGGGTGGGGSGGSGGTGGSGGDPCVAKTCAQLGAECGSLDDDGCGKPLVCTDTCVKPLTCNGAGDPNHCGCTPRTTCGARDCGLVDDRCGDTLDCGDPCLAPDTCGGAGLQNFCGCTPKLCNGACGTVYDGCYDVVDCLGCEDPLVCGGRVANACTDAPNPSCASHAAECGTLNLDSGGTLDCGTCIAPSGCGDAGTPHVCNAATLPWRPLPDEALQNCQEGEPCPVVAYPPRYLLSMQLVTDTWTGLIWQRVTPSEQMTQAQAAAYCEDLGFGEFENFTLPTYQELVTIGRRVDGGTDRLPFDPVVFPKPIDGIFSWWTADGYFGDPTQGVAFGPPGKGFAALVDDPLGVRCVTRTRSAPPDPRFALEDSLALDRNTGVTWTRAAVTRGNWITAHVACVGLELGGHDDFRLPTSKELSSIFGPPRPAGTNLDLQIFTVPQEDQAGACFWSSRRMASDGAWIARMSGLEDSLGRNASCLVLCVR